MYKQMLLAGLLMAGNGAALADPGVFFGVTYSFGQAKPEAGLGVSLKVLSSRKEDHGVVGAGVTYYPLLSSNRFGVDVSAGYLFDHAAVTVGWDFLHSPQIGVGYVNTKDDRAPAVVIPE
jgi:hypothetical protein